MNYKISFLIIFLSISACVTYPVEKDTKQIQYYNYFTNKGFALVYNVDLKNNKIISNKIDDRSLVIFQKNLKKNTKVKLTNLINNKSLIASVGNNSKYPNFYNSVISPRIAKELEILDSEPYIEIKEIIKNSAFIAKKAKTFDEEKEVATKAPIDDIKIKDLNAKKPKENKNKTNIFRYIIKIGDFYFEKSAQSMVSRLKKETTAKNVKINKLSVNKFRVFLGPYDNLNTLKEEFNAISTLQFDNIEIIKK